jgi:hypothetical protein
MPQWVSRQPAELREALASVARQLLERAGTTEEA